MSVIRAMLFAVILFAALTACESKPQAGTANEEKSSENNEPKSESAAEGAVETAETEAVETRADTIAEFSIAVPSSWEVVPPSSKMRVAQYQIPGHGEAEPAELVVYRFAGGAGSKDANIDRWVGQMKNDDGTPATRDAAKVETVEANGLNITILEMKGTYISGGMRPNAPKVDQPGQTMVTAIIEGSGDPLYIKVVGPNETVAHWRADLTTSFTSMKAQ